MSNMQYILIAFSCLTLMLAPNVCIGKEVSVEHAISIARDHASTIYKYDVENADIEVLKVKNGIERGPIRILWLMHASLHEDPKVYVDRDFWVVHFYPKRLLDNNSKILGGGLTAIIDLYTGEILSITEGH